MTKAQEIKKQFGYSWARMFSACEDKAEGLVEDYEQATSTFVFRDGSKIVFDPYGFSVE